MNRYNFSEIQYDEMVEGFEILYATISDPENFQIILKEIKHEEDDLRSLYELETRTISHVPSSSQTGGNIFFSVTSGANYLYSLIYPKYKRSIMLLDTFEVSERETGFIDICKPRNNWDDYTKAGRQLRIIGDHVYACGQLNKLFRREGVGIWKDLTNRKDHPDLFKHIDFIEKHDGSFLNANSGFKAFDGFSESEIYAGGEQTLWAYVNGVWNEMALPEYPRMIDSVLCAGDGQVYVTGRNGPVVRGRNGHWEVMDAPALAYHGMAWFDGKVWLGSDYELGYLEDGQYHRYVFPEEGPAQFSFLSVDACPEMLLSYGPEQALLFDGTEWVEVIGPPLV